MSTKPSLTLAYAEYVETKTALLVVLAEKEVDMVGPYVHWGFPHRTKGPLS